MELSSFGAPSSFNGVNAVLRNPRMVPKFSITAVKD